MSQWQPTAALQGRPMITQGKAQRRPGDAAQQFSQALKGRPIFGWPRRSWFALAGLDLFWAGEPRVLPWAIPLRPVGAGKGGAA